jgi:hypothetical protein
MASDGSFIVGGGEAKAERVGKLEAEIGLYLSPGRFRGWYREDTPLLVHLSRLAPWFCTSEYVYCQLLVIDERL